MSRQEKVNGQARLRACDDCAALCTHSAGCVLARSRGGVLLVLSSPRLSPGRTVSACSQP